MNGSATAVPVRDILPWREKFRAEMQCQIVHDSLHARAGWTQSYRLALGSAVVGYGAIAVGGPWTGTKTVFEFYVAPEFRPQAAALFAALVAAAGVTAFEVQTNDVLMTELLHRWCPHPTAEKIVFHDQTTPALASNGTMLRPTTPADTARMFAHHAEPIGNWLLEYDGTIVATGGILFHYNRPYGDLYMEVAAPFRRRGFGSYLVQELKRLCREGGSIPCARCNLTNNASRATLQKAGFVPCAEILVGPLSAPPG